MSRIEAGSASLSQTSSSPERLVAGRVTVRIKRGERTVSSRTVDVRSDCAYRARFKLPTRAARRARLRVKAAFKGNDVLLPVSARKVSIKTR